MNFSRVIAQLVTQIQKRSWPEQWKILGRVHRHLCEHASCSDITLLLGRNNLWSEGIQKYLSDTLSRCTSYKTTTLPRAERKVFLCSINGPFNTVVYVDHICLDDRLVLNRMDVSTRYSSGSVIDDTVLQ